MQAVVTVLREPGEAGPAESGQQLDPAEPSPGMDRIDDLIEGYRAVGLTIETVVSGAPTALPAAVDLVAYRAVQESLTNVRKHAGKAAVVLEFRYEATCLTIVVRNAGTGSASRAAGARTGSAGGFGLMGMRERVGSVGGKLRAEPTPDGGFVTAVTLPVRETALTQ
jgi:signal transduction histidine kinase